MDDEEDEEEVEAAAKGEGDDKEIDPVRLDDLGIEGFASIAALVETAAGDVASGAPLAGSELAALIVAGS